jgi:hypothetical protein
MVSLSNCIFFTLFLFIIKGHKNIVKPDNWVQCCVRLIVILRTRKGAVKLLAGKLQRKQRGARKGEMAKKSGESRSRDSPPGKACLDQPQLPDPQDPELHPPPPMELVDVIPKPERGPASINSTRIAPQVFIRPSSTKNFRSSWSYTLSLSFGSSRASPSEGPAQPPCIKAIRKAELILFCSKYSLSFSTAWSVTVKSDMKTSRKNKIVAKEKPLVHLPIITVVLYRTF